MQKLHGFIIKEITPLPELCSTLYSCEHINTKAELLHIACDDEENVFCLAFKTLPKDSTGVAHILEHTVLCGSKKYPVKDPFFGMTRRSLNTFMNALTGSDFTCYPAASCIEKDFYNLLDVYLDAVFHPLLKKESFFQEGCRLEFEEKDNPISPLVYRGIVYNEMKGSLASSEARLWEEINKHLMSDLPYSHNSGGDPKEIPNLTYEEFCAFHKNCYAPASCLFYFYGNIPLSKHLAYLDRHLLSKAESSSYEKKLPKQTRFTKPKAVEAFYPCTDKDLKHKTLISFSWLTAPISLEDDLLGLTLLDSLLLDTDASVLKHALLKSGACRQIDGYVDVEVSEIPFHIICKGCDKEKAHILEEILFSTLKKLYDKGFEPEAIASSLHQLELQGTEITGDYYPFGLTLFFRSGLSKLHGSDETKMLKIHSQFEKLLALTKNPRYLPELMKKYLLGNPHFLKVTMIPSSDLADEEIKQEKEKLETIKNALSNDEKDLLVQAALDLEEFQKKQENSDLECLPKLTLEDVPKKTPFFDCEKKELPPLSIYHHSCFTNHFVYVDIVLSLPKLSCDELYYTKLFSLLFSEMGTEKRSYEKMIELIHATTGGISASLGIHSQCNTPDIIKPALHIRGKALCRHTADLFGLLKEMLESISFKEKERVKEVILQIFTELQHKVSKGSIAYATDLAVCHHSIPAYLHHLWHGFGFYTFLEKLAADIDKNIQGTIQKLTMLKEKLLHHHHLDVVITSSQEEFAQIEKADFYGLNKLHKYPYTPWETPFVLPERFSHARKIASPVAFSTIGYKTICAPNPDSPYLALSAQLMQNTVLHKKIREQGGAYGAGASYNIINGNFTFYAYRDPHLASTVKAFQEAANALKEGRFTPLELEEAKFLIIQNIDSPVSPGSRAMDSYAQMRENLRLDLRQAFRDKILSATCEDLSLCCQKYLGDIVKEGTFVTFCKETLLKKEESDLPFALPLVSTNHNHLFNTPDTKR